MSVADTCFLIDLIREDPGAMRVAESAPDVRTTAVSAAGFLYGARIGSRPGLLDAALAFLDRFPILPFDADAAIISAQIAAELRLRISSFDELIAAIAIRHDDVLLSRDAHFTAIPGLRVLQ